MPWTCVLMCYVKVERAQDGGLTVDRHMRTSVQDVFAAGDVCTVEWRDADTWFQASL